MHSFLQTFAVETWHLVAEMAPYLLLGFAVAGILHVVVKESFIERFLGKPGLGGATKASLLGVPMPLCSCAVIPVAASLRRSGASRGATASFLSSTPQTGVDSILATFSLMGGVFTAVRVIVAFVTGIVSGVLIDLFARNGGDASKPETKGCCHEPEEESCCHEDDNEPKRTAGEAARYGLITLPADLASALIIGLVLAGLISALLPADLLSGHLSTGPFAFLIATVISLPLYVCATGSIPMAYALIGAGLSPGAALIFLITGPATNTATVVTVWKMLGKQATFIYLGTLVAIAWIAGGLVNALLSASVEESVHAHEAMHPALWQHLSGVVLIGLLLYAKYASKRKASGGRQDEEKSCCGH